MGWLDVGAGASQGLEKILAEQLAKEQFDRRQAEIERSGRAEEGLRGRQLDINAETNRINSDSMNAYRTGQTTDRREDNIWRRAAGRLPGSDVDPKEIAQEQGILPMSSYQHDLAPDQADVQGQTFVPGQTNQGVPPALAQNDRQGATSGVVKWKGINDPNKPNGGGGAQRSGTALNDVSMLDYGVPYNDPSMTPEKRQRVVDHRAKLEGDLYEKRGEGTGEARYQRPLTVADAQAGGAEVGRRSPDYAGQTPPTQQQITRGQNAQDITGQLEKISGALGILPSENDLAGIAPGMASAFWARTTQRTEFAQLRSMVEQIRSNLSRVAQSNVGTQTEQDANRAIQTLVELEAKWSDPLGGDTQESGRARIAETVAYMREVIKGIPARMTPNPRPGASAAPGAGRIQTPRPGEAGAPTNADGSPNRAGAAPPVGTRRTIQGIPAVWDGTGWEPVAP